MPPKKTKANAPCHCGSGKKHKKCCMVAGNTLASSAAAANSKNITKLLDVLDEQQYTALEEWTPEQEQQLHHGLQRYPSSLGPDQRWSSIAKEVTGKSQKECVTRFEAEIIHALKGEKSIYDDEEEDNAQQKKPAAITFKDGQHEGTEGIIDASLASRHHKNEEEEEEEEENHKLRHDDNNNNDDDDDDNDDDDDDDNDNDDDDVELERLARETLKQDEVVLEEIFASHNLVYDSTAMEPIISEDSMMKLMADELRGSSHSSYHISRALEVLLFLVNPTGGSTVPPPLLILAVERQAGIDLKEAKSDPDFAQWLFFMVTKLLMIDPALTTTMESKNESYFSIHFLRMAVEIKYRLELNNALLNITEEHHGGVRQLYNHKLLKKFRDIASVRGIINICHRETKEFCQWVKPLQLQAKKAEKVGICYGCQETFPKHEVSYCSGCLVHVYCSYECSKNNWAHHKYNCARKNYIRCSTCRVIFPSDELSIHTCMAARV